MAFLIGKIYGNIAANGIQLLAGRHVVLEVQKAPAEAEDGLCAVILCFFDGSRHDFRQELLRIIFQSHNRSDALYGIAHRIVCKTVAAARHHKPLAGIVHHLGLAFFDIGLGTRLVAYIDVLAVLHGKGFHHLITHSRRSVAYP